MTENRRTPGIARELLPVVLIVGCLVGTALLVGGAYRSGAASRRVPRTKPTGAVPVVSLPEPGPPPESPEVAASLPPAPPPRPEDPTERIVTGLKLDEYKERRAAREADRKAASLEAARLAAESQTERRRRREALARSQLSALAEQADALESQADALALDRDLLALERDASKAALEKSRSRSGGYAVLPHKGANGTWQRPVVIECRDGVAILQPRGLAFSMLEMSPLFGARSSPLVGAVAREMMRIEDLSSPDGSPVSPYIYFIVRPNGVRPFYEARGRLEPLGIAFGYELVDQDWEIDFPDLETWEGGTLAEGRPSGASERSYRWPAERPSADPKGEPSNPYLWPRSRPGGAVDLVGEGDAILGEGGARRVPAGGRPSNPSGVPGLSGRLGEGRLPAEGVDATPLLDALARRQPEGLARVPEGRRWETPAGSDRGLAGLPVERLPNLDRVGEPGSGSSGRVRLVPEMLEDEAFDNRPPARPRNELSASSGVPGRGASGGPSGMTGGVGGGPSGGGPPGGTPSGTPGRVVEVPLDLVVACGPEGLTIHPGGYRISKATLAREKRLARDLATIVFNYERIDPTIIPRPRLEFLIEPGGHETFSEARRQTVLNGVDWPVTIRVAESSALDLLGKERF